MKRHNRFLAFALTLAMLISLIPVSAFPVAAEPVGLSAALGKNDLDSNHTFTWDFEVAAHAFVANIGEAAGAYGIVDDPTAASNKVLKVPVGGTVYTPAQWNDSYKLVTATWEFNTRDLSYTANSYFNEIVLWQSNENPKDYISWFWEQKETEYFNDGRYIYDDGEADFSWYAPSLRIGGFSGTDKWFTLTATYSETKIDLHLTSRDGKVDKTGSITATNMGDLREGRIGVKGSNNWANTLYYDNISVQFDISAEDAQNFKANYETLLAMGEDTFQAEYDAGAMNTLVTALADYEELSANAKALLTAEKNKLDELQAVMDSIEEAKLFKPLQKTDLTDGTFTWSFEDASHAFKATSGTEASGFGIVQEVGNSVLKLPSGGTNKTVYGPRRWNNTYKKVEAEFKFRISDFSDTQFRRFILWQDPDNADNWLGVQFKKEGTNPADFGGVIHYIDAETGDPVTTESWGFDNLSIKGDADLVASTGWFTLKVKYLSAKSLEMTLTSPDGAIVRTFTNSGNGSLGWFDYGTITAKFGADIDYREGMVGVAAPGAFCVDDISVKFDYAAEDAQNFKTTYATLLAMGEDTFQAEYDAGAKNSLVTALADYEELSANAKALLTTEKSKLDALQAVMDDIEEAKLFKPLEKTDLTDGTFTWTFEDASHAFKKTAGSVDKDVSITGEAGSKVLTVPGGLNVYTPRRWNDNWSLVSASWDFDVSAAATEGDNAFNEIIIWQSATDPTDYITYRWKKAGTALFDGARAVYTDGTMEFDWWANPMKITDFTNADMRFTLTAVYSEGAIDLTLTSKADPSVTRSTKIQLTTMGDLRQGRIGVKGSLAAANTISYDTIAVKFELSPAETAADFEATYATLLAMDEEDFRAAYDTVKQTQIAAQADFAVMSDEAKALLADGVAEQMDALNNWAVIIENERLHASLTKDDLTDYTYTWNFEKADYANPFYAAQGSAAAGFGYAEMEGTDGVLKVPTSTTAIYKPMNWGSDFMMESVSWKFNVKDQTQQAMYFNEIRVWQDPVEPENYVAFCWRYEGVNILNTQYQIHAGGTVYTTWTGSMHVTETEAGEERWFILTADYTKTGIKLTVSSACLATPKSLQVNETQLAELGADLRKGDIAIRCQNTNLYFDTITAKFTQKSVDGDPGHTIEMHYGAYLRTNGEIGIRFGADISGETEKVAVGYGILILPVEKLGNHELNLDWISLDTTPVSDVTAAHAYKELAADAELPAEVYAAIVEILDGTYPTMSLVARVYVKYDDGSVSYSNLSVDRSMYQTAMLGVNSYITEGKITEVDAFTPAQYDPTNQEYDPNALITNGKLALTILKDAGIIQWEDTAQN